MEPVLLEYQDLITPKWPQWYGKHLSVMRHDDGSLAITSTADRRLVWPAVWAAPPAALLAGVVTAFVAGFTGSRLADWACAALLGSGWLMCMSRDHLFHLRTGARVTVEVRPDGVTLTIRRLAGMGEKKQHWPRERIRDVASKGRTLFLRPTGGRDVLLVERFGSPTAATIVRGLVAVALALENMDRPCGTSADRLGH